MPLFESYWEKKTEYSPLNDSTRIQSFWPSLVNGAVYKIDDEIVYMKSLVPVSTFTIENVEESPPYEYSIRSRKENKLAFLDESGEPIFPPVLRSNIGFRCERQLIKALSKNHIEIKINDSDQLSEESLFEGHLTKKWLAPHLGTVGDTITIREMAFTNAIDAIQNDIEYFRQYVDSR